MSDRRTLYWYLAGFWMGLGSPVVRETVDLVGPPAAWHLWVTLGVGIGTVIVLWRTSKVRS